MVRMNVEGAHEVWAQYVKGKKGLDARAIPQWKDILLQLKNQTMAYATVQLVDCQRTSIVREVMRMKEVKK
jgi:hypothetical protein